MNASVQGISVFDGEYSNLQVTRNVVIVSAYHGISMYGPVGALIAENTVAGIDPGQKTWISTPPRKTGEVPVNTVVRDNVAVSFVLDPAVTGSNNQTVSYAEAADNFVVFAPATATFDLHPKPGSKIDGAHAGAY